MASSKTTCLIELVVVLIIFVQIINGAFCPGHSVRCKDTQTCCQAKVEAGYACCPYQNATCCSDQLHCCPQNTDCDSAHRRCVPRTKSNEIPWTSINNELETDENEITNQNCPGSSMSCPDTYTCCEMASGGYGCCPMSLATCCADKVHCCPHGTTCNSGSCAMKTS